MRLDVYLFSKNMVQSREKASVLIKSGKVSVNGVETRKCAYDVSDADIVVVSELLKYVGRGGYKLEKALDVFHIDIQDKVCLDIGASTGGFTDCMLQNGAEKVYAVDVGDAQLVNVLRDNPRVVCMEKTDIRLVRPFPVDFISADVSFISLKMIFPVITSFLIHDKGCAVCLIKPQFEIGKKHIKNGVVRDAGEHIRIISEIVLSAKENGLSILGLDYSPIKGGNGNIEFLLFLGFENDSNDYCIEKTVSEAHKLLKKGSDGI